ncbi:MAG: hypothetical protein ACQESP_01630 [Candidatus Muiribacteriota bacterium]
MKKLIFLSVVLISCFTVNSATVYFDSMHAQDAGNAEWTIEGGYSDLVNFLEKHGFNVIKEQRYITDSLEDIDILVLPEPNFPYSTPAIQNLLHFVKNGGSLYLIGNHSGADRNGSGFDSVKIFNEFAYHFGFTFENDNWTDVYFKMNSHPINKNLELVCGFGSSSINISDKTNVKPVLYTSFDAPYMVSTDYGKGRVVAVGDSSIYDDGTSTDGSNLHNVFNSYMFSNHQWALNTFNYLARKDFKQVERKIPFRNLPEANGFIVDFYHANYGADDFYEAAVKVEKAGLIPYYNKEPFSKELLEVSEIILIVEPAREFSKREIALLKKYPDIKLIFVSYSDFNSLNKSYLNSLISELSSTNMRFGNNQVLNPESQIGSGPWTFIAPHKYPPIVFSTCSIANTAENDNILLEAGQGAHIPDSRDSEKTIPLIASTEDYRITLAGFSFFTDYSFRSSPYYSENYENVLHETENFVRYVISNISKGGQK